jgi:serine/threonine kinase 16
VVQDTDGDGKIVYLFLPLYSRGNLQDAINTHSLNGTHFSEAEILAYFKGTCEAVKAMHTFHAPIKKSTKPNGSASASGSNAPQAQPQHTREDSVDEDERNQMLPEPEGDEEGGFSYDNSGRMGVPLLTKKSAKQVDVIFDGDQELAEPQSSPDGEVELVPYAHRDLKPG